MTPTARIERVLKDLDHLRRDMERAFTDSLTLEAKVRHYGTMKAIGGIRGALLRLYNAVEDATAAIAEETEE
jgi:hypothetical protein